MVSGFGSQGVDVFRSWAEGPQCTQVGVDAPLLQHAIAALTELGTEGLRSNLTALMDAQQAV